MKYKVDHLTIEQCSYILDCQGGALFQLRNEIYEKLINKDQKTIQRYDEILN